MFLQKSDGGKMLIIQPDLFVMVRFAFYNGEGAV